MSVLVLLAVAVQRRVRLLDDRMPVHRGGVPRRPHTGTYRHDPERAATMGDREVLDRGARPLRGLAGAVEPGLGQHHQDLFAPVAVERVALARRRAQAVGDLAQNLVSG